MSRLRSVAVATIVSLLGSGAVAGCAMFVPSSAGMVDASSWSPNWLTCSFFTTELLDGIRDYARKCFGYLGRAVFESWGLTSSAEFGDIVFDLVERDVLAKQETDSKSDFEGGFVFAAAFEESFIHD